MLFKRAAHPASGHSRAGCGVQKTAKIKVPKGISAPGKVEGTRGDLEEPHKGSKICLGYWGPPRGRWAQPGGLGQVVCLWFPPRSHLMGLTWELNRVTCAALTTGSEHPLFNPFTKHLLCAGPLYRQKELPKAPSPMQVGQTLFLVFLLHVCACPSQSAWHGPTSRPALTLLPLPGARFLWASISCFPLLQLSAWEAPQGGLPGCTG